MSKRGPYLPAVAGAAVGVTESDVARRYDAREGSDNLLRKILQYYLSRDEIPMTMSAATFAAHCERLGVAG